MANPLLQVQDAICRINQRKTLRVESFIIKPGEHWCFLGGNGAGKTLFAQLLLGRLRSGHGHVNYCAPFDPQRDIVVVSFEEQQQLWERDNRHDISEYNENALDQGTTVAALILNGAAIDARYERLLDQLDIRSLQNKGIRYLSSGQMRKALIARALLSNPRLLVLDDPLETLDRAARVLIAQVISQWCNADNSSILLSRRRDDYLQATTHLLLMRELEVVAQGELATINASQEYHALFNTRPTIPEELPAPCPGYELPELDSDWPLLELIDVSAAWQAQPVLNNVSWTMRQGQHVLIEGPNGCGKSTLLSLINAENHKAYGQQVKLFGRLRGSGETVWDVKARFGVVSNELHNRYRKGWRVLDVVVSGFFSSIGLFDESGASAHNTAKAWLHTLGLNGLNTEYYHELSFGQQRLVLLARAMVRRPTILILDEPCVGLDDWYKELLLGTLDVIARTTDTHLIYVSHTAGEHPHCINQSLQFIPYPLLSGAEDHESIHSTSPYRLEIREGPPLP